jgi:hypothetical protein
MSASRVPVALEPLPQAEPKEDSTMTRPPAQPRSRRALLAGAAGGAAAFFASAVAHLGRARAAAGDPLILGQANSAGSAATRLYANSTGGAFWMTQNGSGSGVRGEATFGTGGIFVSHATNHNALVAQHQGVAGGTGAALRAEGGQRRGIVATTAHENRTAIEATNTAGGVAISAFSMNERAVSGQSVSSFGVFGQSGSNAGVYGYSDNIGVAGFSSTYVGVEGGSDIAQGVLGTSTSGHGVHGTSVTGSAGYFDGNVQVTGTLSKGGGSFRIDHPLDPANRILQHSFVESPDMKNVYDGVVTADAQGEATVVLPDWFGVLNGEVRYQLTPVGAAMPNLHVKTKFANLRFGIAGAIPRLEVSWQLTGIRRDAWAVAHRIAVEFDKPVDQRGLYLHPIEHGQPETKGVDYPIRQKARSMLKRTG